MGDFLPDLMIPVGLVVKGCRGFAASPIRERACCTWIHPA
jgi:hypothetical protein